MDGGIALAAPRARQRTQALLVADLFCGAGGSSQGAKRALERLGFVMKLLCVNHWPTAIETHKRNHPDARHFCQDVSTVRPHIVIPEGRLDLLMASPTCTYHSRARGGKPTSDQQRMDPWHIVTWLTELRVRCLLVENVPEFVQWGPVDSRTGRPVKRRRGEYFLRWLETIRGLGFEVDWRFLNAADYGDATTRERFFLIARSDGKPLRWPSPTHAKQGRVADLLGPPLPRWRSAREIIDWTLEGRSIFTRKTPLAQKTLKRIEAGMLKFGWPEPFIVALRRHMAGRSIDEPLPTVCAEATHLALCQPFVLSNASSGAPRSVSEPVPTITTGGAGSDGHKGCARHAVIEPFVVANRENNTGKAVDEPIPGITTAHGGGIIMVEPFIVSTRQHTGGPAPRSAEAPLPTLTAADSRIAVVEPFVFQLNQSRRRVRGLRSTVDPLCTITATGTDLGLVEPFLTVVAHGDSVRERDPSRRRARSIADPLGAITASGVQFAVVEPFILNRHGADGGPGRARDVDEPVPTVTTSGAGYVVEPFILSRHAGGAPRAIEEPTPCQVAKHSHVLIAPYYGSGSGETCRSVEDPLATVTAKPRFGLVMPVTHGDGGNRARSVDQPIATITCAARGELAFISAAFGERPGQAPRVHDVREPCPTICAEGRVQLVEPGSTPERQWDIRFRMLEPHELAAAMGFNDSEQAYEFTGTKTEKTRQIGNAVPVNTASALVGALMGC